jgi:hypothetical protein
MTGKHLTSISNSNMKKWNSKRKQNYAKIAELIPISPKSPNRNSIGKLEFHWKKLEFHKIPLEN